MANFGPAVLEQVIGVPLFDDTQAEVTENYSVTLTNPVGAPLNDASTVATGLILDDGDGTSNEPEIAVFDAAGMTLIPDEIGHVDFGTTTVGSPINVTFQVRNLGADALNLSTPIALPAGFSLVA